MIKYVKADESNRCRYATHFKLDGEPGDHGSWFDDEEYEKAQDFLFEENLANYYDGLGKDKINSIDWVLMQNTEGSGFIVVDTYEPLTQDELDAVSEYISGQNSDGIGESFEQRFSYYIYDDSDDDWEYSGDSGDMCSFDWMYNPYKLYRLGTHYPESFWLNIAQKLGNWE